MEKEINGVQVSRLDAYHQQTVIMTEIDEGIVVVVHRLEGELAEIANAKLSKIDVIPVPELLREIEQHFLTHPGRKDKVVIGQASSHQADLLHYCPARMTVADRDIVRLCSDMVGERIQELLDLAA